MKDTRVEYECYLEPIVDQVRESVAAATTNVSQLADRYAEHGRKLTELVDELNGVVDAETGEITLDGIKPRLDKLEEQVDKLTEKKSKGQRNWFRVKEVDTAAKWLTELQEWLDAEFCYIAKQLPACWFWHPAAVADLLALQDHYEEAYKGSSPVSVTDLWARALDATKKRLEGLDVLGRCDADGVDDEWTHKHCRDVGTGKKTINAAATTALIPVYAEWWVTSRDPATAPQPVEK